VNERLRMTRDAVAVSVGAYEHALRLGYRYLGSEHFLLALACTEQPAGTVLREQGVTAERVEEEIARRAGDVLFGDFDRDALASIGIDADAVHASIEASLAPQVLTSASEALRRQPRLRKLDPRRVSGAGGKGGFLKHSPAAEQTLFNARLAARARHDIQISAEHLALGLLAACRGPVPFILSALAVPAARLRGAILDRYPQAS
jgi:Clp amino terminal domain, pathogenicity island component